MSTFRFFIETIGILFFVSLFVWAFAFSSVFACIADETQDIRNCQDNTAGRLVYKTLTALK